MSDFGWEIKENKKIVKEYNLEVTKKDGEKEIQFYSPQYQKISLMLFKVKDNITKKYKLYIKFEIETKSGNKIEGSAYCNLSGLDEELMNLNEYGCILNRADVTSIRNIINNHLLLLPDKEDDPQISEIYRNILDVYVGYLKENNTNKNNENDKFSYTISVKDFNDVFNGIETTGVSLSEFKNWLIGNEYILTFKSGSTKVIRTSNGKTQRVICFNEGKCKELFDDYDINKE